MDFTIDPGIDYFDFRERENPRQAASEWMDNDYATTLDLTRDRLVEMTILQTGDRDYLWYTRIHHVALDGYSGMTIVNRIAAIYTAAVEGREPAVNKALDVTTLSEARPEVPRIEPIRSRPRVLGPACVGRRTRFDVGHP